MAVSGVGITVVAIGGVLAWSGITGASVLQTIQEVVQGKKPSGVNAHPISAATPPSPTPPGGQAPGAGANGGGNSLPGVPGSNNVPLPKAGSPYKTTPAMPQIAPPLPPPITPPTKMVNPPKPPSVWWNPWTW